MKRQFLFCAALLGAFASTPCLAQEMKTATPRTASGERVMRIEMTVRQSPEIVWKSFATVEGLQCWVAPVVRLDLRTGGSLFTNYDKNAAIGDAGTISLGITNYLESEQITYKVNLNDAFPANLRSEDKNLQEVVQLQRTADGGTRIVSSMVGWGTGEAWDKAFEFFIKGNEWSIRNLGACLSKVGS